ncbi:MAG: sulfatase-like hydrolase/transferase [Planctomycetes bacterium]|nr:sulfatase-like hydrolase/transferase [Planctomycetota bacterium]
MAARGPTSRDIPLLLALLGLGAAARWPGAPLVALPLLFCPGWGLVRTLSEIDRNFGVLGASFACSTLVLGLLTTLSARAGFPAERLALLVHGATLLLCIVGRLRIARYDRWLASQPPHPDPMPLWPQRTAACVIVLGLTLAAALSAIPRDGLGSPVRLEQAALASAWQSGGEHPFLAGRTLDGGAFFAASAAGLSAASGVHPGVTAPMLALASLLSCLLMVAEGISRLWGNRGATRAMLAFLLGVNPLAGILLWGEPNTLPLAERVGAGFDPTITTALTPFLDAAPLAATLAAVTMLLFTTLSVLRRSSRHVPRLMAASGCLLVLCDPRAALLLLPGWFVGLLMSHLACRGSPDNDPIRGETVRRAREPRVLRAPFWRPALHLAVGVALAAPLVLAPDVVVEPTRVAAWSLLAGLGPFAIFFLPGVRHLNASPGREAFFFVGLVVLASLTGYAVRFEGDEGGLAVRLLAAVLAVPSSNGVMKLLAWQGRRAALPLLAFGALLLPGPWAAVHDAARREPLAVVGTGDTLVESGLPPSLDEALRLVDERAPAEAVLLLVPLPVPDDAARAVLVARRPLVVDLDHAAVAPARVLDLEQLADGDGTALQHLRCRSDLSGRPLWAVHGGEAWPGFQPIARVGVLHVERARPPDVVLVTVSSLRADKVAAGLMPSLTERAEHGLLFQTALTPMPSTRPALTSLLTGLSPLDHDVRSADAPVPFGLTTLAQEFARRGYRTSALVALGHDDSLLDGFEDVHADRRARAGELVDVALDRLAQADPRPLFLWLHLSDLELPYALPQDARTKATGTLDFPIQNDLRKTVYGVAAFPPTPRDAGVYLGGDEVDVATGLAQYDALLGVVDHALARLLDSVPSDDLLVVTAPHGTSLDEHDTWFGHGPDLFEPSVRVPLLLAGAGMPAEQTDALVSLEDVRELLLGGRLPTRTRVLLESDWRPGSATGRAADPALDASSRGAARRVWAERTATRKTILVQPERGGAPARGVTYDLQRDPDELHPYPADPFTLRRLDTWRRLGRVLQPPAGGRPGERP